MAERRATKDQENLKKLFEKREHFGGRLPQILEEVPPPGVERPEPAALLDKDEETPPTRGPRAEKKSGLHIILHTIRRDGFPHPLEQGGFLMLPKVFKVLLSLEPVSVIQVVYEVFEQTIGWIDPHAEHGRREWARLPLRHFELACGMSPAQVKRGIKRALQHGYMLRRPCFDSFEYGIRWADNPNLPSRF